MPATKTTPGVYVEEISKFPPSVAAVKTAIPAFVGYTEKAGKNNDLYKTPIRIASLLDYETIFGGAPPMNEIKISLDGNLVSKIEPKPAFYLYHSLQLFFANGGGACFIVAVNNYGHNALTTNASKIDKTELIAGIESIAIEDEPTLLVCPDSCLLGNRADCMDVYTAMLDQCEKLQDRFAILDIYDGFIDFKDTNDVIADFRQIPSNSNLKYGAAYYPFVRSTIGLPFDHGKIRVDLSSIVSGTPSGDILDALNSITSSGRDLEIIEAVLNDTEWRSVYKDAKEDDMDISDSKFTNRTEILKDLIPAIRNLISLSEDLKIGTSPISDKNSMKSYIAAIKNISAADFSLGGIPNIIDATTPWDKDNIDNYFNQAMTILENLYEYAKSRVKYLEDQLTLNNGFYAYIRQSIESQGLILPPSAMMAGVYARVDNLRGVWKAPANVGLNMVIAPTVKISHEAHGELNVDTSGKSINAIRSYIGKGTMVMGARTLAGNSNEWRYISVRRLFIFIEESVQEACEQFLFEPNDANTWVNVKGMINNFLYNLWRDGALAGAKADEAYYIKIGLAETMTSQDILEGIMNVEIGLAAVRPAEFIVLKFSHKLQTS